MWCHSSILLSHTGGKKAPADNDRERREMPMTFMVSFNLTDTLSLSFALPCGWRDVHGHNARHQKYCTSVDVSTTAQHCFRRRIFWRDEISRDTLYGSQKTIMLYWREDPSIIPSPRSLRRKVVLRRCWCGWCRLWTSSQNRDCDPMIHPLKYHRKTATYWKRVDSLVISGQCGRKGSYLESESTIP